MKKILSILLAAVLCIGLLPLSTFAVTTLKHVDITVELPKGGDYFDRSCAPTITSFKSGSIDLLANGAGFIKTSWDGEYDLDGNGTPCFRKGGSYNVTFKLMFGSGYCAAGTTASTGETVVMPETFSATVNGKAATVQRNGSTYYPEITVSLKLEGEALSAAEKTERNEEWEALKATRRAILTPRTKAEAEAYNRDNMPEKVVVVSDSEGKDLMAGRDRTCIKCEQRKHDDRLHRKFGIS